MPTDGRLITSILFSDCHLSSHIRDFSTIIYQPQGLYKHTPDSLLDKSILIRRSKKMSLIIACSIDIWPLFVYNTCYSLRIRKNKTCACNYFFFFLLLSLLTIHQLFLIDTRADFSFYNTTKKVILIHFIGQIKT